MGQDPAGGHMWGRWHTELGHGQDMLWRYLSNGDGGAPDTGVTVWGKQAAVSPPPPMLPPPPDAVPVV